MLIASPGPAAGGDKRSTRSRKVSQRMAIVDDSTRKQAGPLLPACLPHPPPHLQLSLVDLMDPLMAPVARRRPQVAAARLDALENDNEQADTFGLDSGDDEFVIDESDDDGGRAELAPAGWRARTQRRLPPRSCRGQAWAPSAPGRYRQAGRLAAQRLGQRVRALSQQAGCGPQAGLGQQAPTPLLPRLQSPTLAASEPGRARRPRSARRAAWAAQSAAGPSHLASCWRRCAPLPGPRHCNAAE
jgi:hypothetical protein